MLFVIGWLFLTLDALAGKFFDENAFVDTVSSVASILCIMAEIAVWPGDQDGY